VVEVQLLPTENEPLFQKNRLVSVDIMATDRRGLRFHIEMQRARHTGLDARILFAWARMIAKQLPPGSTFSDLKPVYSIWVLETPLAGDLAESIETFSLTNAQGRPLTPEGNIVLVQPARYQSADIPPLALREGWLYFFQHAAAATDLPSALSHLPTMHEVMTILATIANNADEYDAYQRRLDAQRIELAWQRDLEQALQAAEAAMLAKEEERRAKEEALALVESLARELEELRRNRP
jgi:predicted transposase/invertase (TIGR01784 family)